ncbi:hypothetical protein MCOR07_007929 [Pyricularia oryzae]|uniref:Geranylgeranyl pyrophosphate synthase n=1 Tax=Pyricularia grisea TaxID=148305 RepID=A0ABQ8P3J5_PYRGI|nr:hypothetical protein MCOR01_000203 [Pyricularia oryzae]KAI6304792.1 hypothetical protein MCOR33_000304 [Pyricularia grisea]KAI6287587.1 hypothetical protein MCOR26_000486 [Pyricularia oryzae]KAI6330240.1 hypothetical protein MCOR29_002016 [Pyricularia oryzae]KAI6344406.1 hypothetical protein MCOR30_001231 [Pyricularia oryzae]
MMDRRDIYPYSIPVDREEVTRSGALTTLPVRIHRHNHLADAGALCLVNDWRHTMKDGQETRSNGSPCVVGNWASFIWPESDPERLGLLTYLLDVGCFHDDACEEMTMASAHEEHLDLAGAMDVEDKRMLSKDSRSLRTKQLVSKAVLECIKIDRQGAMRMLEAYRKKWLRIMETYNTDEIDGIDDYFLARANNGGMGAYYAMLEFSLGISVSDDEYATMAEPITHVERCMLLTNDYWSWPRERDQAEHQESGKVFNVVWFLMRKEQCSEADAMDRVRELIHAEERAWTAAKERLYDQCPKLRPDLVRLLESLETALAGNDYWSSRCYRHHDWRHVAVRPVQDGPEIHELAGMGKALAMNLAADNDRTRSGASSPESSSSAAGSSSSHTAEMMPHSPLSSVKSTPTSATSEGSLPGMQAAPVFEPARYIRQMPSKNMRSQLMDCFNLWLEVPQPSLAAIKETIDCLHHSSLILDDIEDGSDLRRGLPAAHIVYGVGQAINSATHLHVQAVANMHAMASREGRPQMMDVFLHHLNQLFIGQSWDLHWTFHRRCPTEEKYLDMIDQKTGAMLQMLLELMQTAAAAAKQGVLKDGKHLLWEFTRLFGRFFQVRDDYMNTLSTEYERQKGFASDLNEQKLSYMLVHMFEVYPETRDKVEGVFNTMRRGGVSEGAVDVAKTYILSMMEETGTNNFTYKLLQKWHGQVLESIGALEKHFGVENGMLRLLVETLRV